MPDTNSVELLSQGNALRTQIATRSTQLQTVAAELKQELIGIDDVIDRVIESIRAWYVLPQIIKRPVIVCLWGLTGTGKTQLTRSLAQKLGFYSRFVEVQMDGFSNGSEHRAANTISEILNNTIEEGEPGILVLDEFQRFRTIDAQGKDVSVLRYMDVWALLSDGRMAPSLSFMQDLQMNLADRQYELDFKSSRKNAKQGEAEDETDEDAHATVGLSASAILRRHSSGKDKHPRKFQISPYSAREIKTTLKSKESLLDIMTWSPEEVMQQLEAFCQNSQAWETDYSKLLVFVCGNLDEMYEKLASSVEDCDTDADIFNRVTRKLSVIDVKRALLTRFKPEQIARLGNCHVIYPSFSKSTFEHLVESNVARYLADMQETSGLKFTVSQALKDQIYINGVFPSQGTRPLFSTIHSVLSGALVQVSLWAIEQGAVLGDTVHLDIQVESPHTRQAELAMKPRSALHTSPTSPIYPDLASADTPQLIASWKTQTCRISTILEITALKNRGDEDFRALLAVHEAGHALVYSLLTGIAPVEVKINPATYVGGYNTFTQRLALTAGNILDAVCVDMGGRAAEWLVFGEAFVTSGSAVDIKHATQLLSEYVRYLGFAQRLTRTDRVSDETDSVNTDMAPTNDMMESLLHVQYERAQVLLRENCSMLVQMAQALRLQGELTPEQLHDWLSVHSQQRQQSTAGLAGGEGNEMHKGHAENAGQSGAHSGMHPFARMLNTFALGQSDLFGATTPQ